MKDYHPPSTTSSDMTTKRGIREFTDQNFEAEVLQSSNLVLVDFWASWCQPCHALAPLIEEIAGKYKGSVRVGKLNTEENEETSTVYNIRAIPTVLLFRDGELVERLVGAAPKEKYVKLIEQHIDS